MLRRVHGALSSVLRLVKLTHAAWVDNHASFMAAALAFYALISIAPLLIILLAVTGAFFGPAEVQEKVAYGLRTLLGLQGAELLETLSSEAFLHRRKWIASILGITVVVYGSTRVFAELQRALRVIWHDPEVAPAFGGVLHWIKTYLLSFLMVIGVGLLWIVGIVSSTTISVVEAWIGDRVPPDLSFAVQVHSVLSFGLLTTLLALIYRYVPGHRVRWLDVWIGSLFTAILITVGQKLIGIYLGYQTISSIYGAAGSLVVVVFWFYYSWTVFLLGAVFTKVYSTDFRKDPGRNSGG